MWLSAVLPAILQSPQSLPSEMSMDLPDVRIPLTPQRTRRSRSEPASRLGTGLYSDHHTDFTFDSTYLKIGDRVALWSEGESSHSHGFVSTLG